MSENPGFTMLSPRESEQLLNEHPELKDGRWTSNVAAFTASSDAELAALGDMLIAVRTAFTSASSSSDAVLKALLPDDRLTLGPGGLAQVRRMAEMRHAVAERYGLLTAADVAEHSGSRAANGRALASRWKSSNLVFAVPVDQGIRYPGFQFDGTGRPLPGIQRVLEVLADRLDAWQIAAWFTSDNGWLGDVAPADVVADAPDEVVEAAKRLLDELP